MYLYNIDHFQIFVIFTRLWGKFDIFKEFHDAALRSQFKYSRTDKIFIGQ